MRQPSTGTPSVSSSSAVAGTSSSDLTPDETTSACVCGERLQVGRDVGRRRPAAVHAAEAAGRHEADARPPCRRRACRRPSSRRPRPARRRRRGRAGRSCAPRRRSARARPRSARRRSRRRGRRSSPAPTPPSRTARSEASPTSTPSPGGKPCATSVVSSATTPRPSRERLARTSSAMRITASPRASRSSARPPRARAPTPPTRKPAANASPAPVASTTSVAAAGMVTPSTRTPSRAALHDPARRRARPSAVALALGREDDVGRELAQPLAERVVDQRPRREVDRDRRPSCGAARAAAATAAAAIGSRSSA